MIVVFDVCLWPIKCVHGLQKLLRYVRVQSLSEANTLPVKKYEDKEWNKIACLVGPRLDKSNVEKEQGIFHSMIAL